MPLRESVVELRSVTKRYGALVALDNVTLSIPPAKIVGLLGPSGSGKTTLIRTIVGAVRATSGDVHVFGERMPSRSVASRVGYMTQATALYEELSLRENLLFFGEIYNLAGAALKRRVEAIAEDVELADRLDSPLRTFSGGMRQRASLAAALLHAPQLVLLDEPTVGLDPVLRIAFWRRFRTMAESGVCVVISSHAMDEAGRCDSLAFMRDGRILATGSPADLLRQTGAPTLEHAFLRLAGATAHIAP